MHTPSELERHLLLWTSAELGWCSQDPNTVRERTIITSQSNYVHLVEGGRWLLVAHDKTGAVTYYDLDAETLQGSSLIPDQIKPYETNNILMSVDYDKESSVLNFTIAFSLLLCAPRDIKQNPDNDVWTVTVQIWRVEVLLDDSHRLIGLKSTCLASFPQRSAIASIQGISLSGNMLAFAAIVDKELGGTARYAIVLDWMQAVGNLTMEKKAAHHYPSSPPPAPHKFCKYCISIWLWRDIISEIQPMDTYEQGTKSQ